MAACAHMAYIPQPQGATSAIPKTLPINLKHLTNAYLGAIARALEIRTNRLVVEMRQMVDGRLSDEGREPANVQVQIIRAPSMSCCLMLTASF